MQGGSVTKGAFSFILLRRTRCSILKLSVFLLYLANSYKIWPWMDLSKSGGRKCGAHGVHMALNLFSFSGKQFFFLTAEEEDEVIHQAMKGVCRAAPRFAWAC